MESFKKSSADCGIKKAKKQLLSYFKDPVPGTKMFIVENRLDTFHVNTLIETGEYAGTVIHWKLVIPDDYPFKPAKGWIMEDFYFEEHHHHCFKSSGICTDYLQNFAYMNASASVYGGWTPGCTLTSLMIAMKQFFADHDCHPQNLEAFKLEAKIVLERSKKYKCKECGATAEDLFNENSGNGSVAETCSKDSETERSSKDSEVNNNIVSTQHQRALLELVCPVLGRSPLEDETMLIGFPIDVKCFNKASVNSRQPRIGSLESAMSALGMTFKSDDEKRIRQLKMVNAELFPEFLSLEAYCTDLAIRGSTMDNLNGIQLRSSLGNRYTHIVPIYLSEKHYERSESYLKTIISVICFGVDGSTKSDFHPSMFVKVYPALMNKQIVSLLKCEAYDSEMLLTAFANLLRTYRYVCSRYPEVQEINDKHVLEFCEDEKYRTKEWTNDLGELLFKMAAVDRIKNPKCSFENMETKKIFMEEFFARLIFWADKYWKQKGEYNFFTKFNNVVTKILSSETDEKTKIEIQNECGELLNKFFLASNVSLKLLLFNIECLRTFVTPDFDALLDSNYGLLDKERIQAFRRSMEEIKELSKLSEFFQRSKCPIQSLESALRLIMKAYNDAKRFGYFS